MPRVLILCEYSSLNGGERSLLAVLGGLRTAGFQPTIAGPPHGELPAAVAEAGLGYVPIELHRADGTRLELAECRRRVQQLVRVRSADLLHANSLSMSRLVGPVAEGLSLPCLGHIRDIGGISRAVVADLNRNTRLLAVSEATRRFYVNAGVDAARIFLCHNGVDLNVFRPRAPRGFLHRELGLPSGALLVVTAGQIGMRKGLHHLVRAAQTVCARQPEAQFLVFGRRYSTKAEAVEYERQLLRTTSEGVLVGRFHLPGVRGDMSRALNEATVLAHAARQEPLGRVLLEAAASGVPVVATDVGGTREIFPNVDAGALVVPPDDPAALAEALLSVLDEPPLRERMSAAARRRAVQAFDARRAATRLATHYRAVIDSIASTRV